MIEKQRKKTEASRLQILDDLRFCKNNKEGMTATSYKEKIQNDFKHFSSIM